MRVFITGGAGFVASHLADACIERGYETYVLDNLTTGRQDNIPNKAEWINIDLATDPIEPIFAEVKPDIVFHHAANASVSISVKQPLYDQQVNIAGTIKLLEAAKNHNVRKVIYASSAAIYGNPAYLPIDEKHPIAPISPYGISKYVPELYLKTYKDLHHLNFTALRYANIYGPRQIAEGEGGVVAIFTDRVVKGEPIIIQGDGEQTRDFIYISDVVAANLAAIEHGDGGIFNIGTGQVTSINQLVESMQKVVGQSIEIQHSSPREGDIRHSYFNSQAATEGLKWEPKVTLSEGLKKTLQYYQNQA